MNKLVSSLLAVMFLTACSPTEMPDMTQFKEITLHQQTASDPTYQLLDNITSADCDQTLWQHVYHPDRLVKIKDCITVTGTLEVVRKEGDGDEHWLVRLDDSYLSLISQSNIDRQHGDLVVEPVCKNIVTQTDAIDACDGFGSNIFTPPIGSHIKLVGSYVSDSQHFGWMEIHPLSKVEVI